MRLWCAVNCCFKFIRKWTVGQDPGRNGGGQAHIRGAAVVVPAVNHCNQEREKKKRGNKCDDINNTADTQPNYTTTTNWAWDKSC